MTYRVTYGSHQDDLSVAAEGEVGRAPTLAAARAIVRECLGLHALRQERSWHRPADHVIEGWCESLDPAGPANGYFITPLRGEA